MASPRRLDSAAPGFEAELQRLLAFEAAQDEGVERATAAILADVRARGDAALMEYSLRFDRIDVERASLRVSAEEIDAAVAACPKTALEALKFAHQRILAFHRRQIPKDESFTDAFGHPATVAYDLITLMARICTDQKGIHRNGRKGRNGIEGGNQHHSVCTKISTAHHSPVMVS